MVLEKLRDNVRDDCYQVFGRLLMSPTDLKLTFTMRHEITLLIILQLIVREEMTDYICTLMLEWSKCGTDALSALPTLVWALGAAALARRLLLALFRRSLFRRVPYWELMLQHLLFVWMVVYSVHLWTVLVRLVKLLVGYLYDESVAALFDEESPDQHNRYVAEQCAVWAAGAAPLAALYCTRPRPQPPPLMIWITTSPWQRRELGPHGYYLQRPPPAAAPHAPPAPKRLRRAASDSRLADEILHAKKRYSKSV